MSDIVLELETSQQERSSPAEPARKPGPVSLWGYCLAGLAAIFYLPYLFPVKPASSFSYAYGYNNRVGILLTLLFAGGGALWMRRTSVLTVSEEDDIPMRGRALLLGLGGTLLLCAAAFPFVNSATPVGDAAYLINRMQLLAAGQRPYWGFEFAYGPLFLYPPVWIAHLLHVGIAQAYYYFWVLNELTGVFLLFRVIDEIDIPSRKKSEVFLLFCAASGATIVLGGLNYTFTRFALAPWLAFRIYRLDAKGWRPFALAAFSYIVLLLVSPEIAISFGIGSLGFLFLRGHVRRVAWWTGYTAMISGMAATTYIGVRTHLFATLGSFAGGAFDFPVFPAGHILLFLACVIVSILHLARKAFRSEQGTSFYLILISIPMLASALGCCDPLHVLYGGFGFLAVGLVYLSGSGRYWHPARLVFCIFFVLVLFSGVVLDGGSQYEAKLEQIFGADKGNPHILQAEAFPGTQGVLEAPFGFTRNGTEAPFVSWIDTGRYLGTINAHSLRDIRVKEEELEKHPQREVLVPEWYDAWRVFDVGFSRRWLEVEYAAPFWMPLKNAVNPYAGLCNFLDAHYHRVWPASPQSFNYEVWARNQ